MESGTHVLLPDGKCVGVLIGRVVLTKAGKLECLVCSRGESKLDDDAYETFASKSTWHVQVLGFYITAGRDQSSAKPIIVQVLGSLLSPLNVVNDSMGLGFAAITVRKCPLCKERLEAEKWRPHPMFWFMVCKSCGDKVEACDRETCCKGCGKGEPQNATTRHTAFKRCSDCKVLLCNSCVWLKHPLLWIAKQSSCVKCWVQTRSRSCAKEAAELANREDRSKNRLEPRESILKQIETVVNEQVVRDISNGQESYALQLVKEKWISGIEKKPRFTTDYHSNFADFRYVTRTQIPNQLTSNPNWLRLTNGIGQKELIKPYPLTVKVVVCINVRSGRYYVRTLEDLKAGTLLCEYAGVVKEQKQDVASETVEPSSNDEPSPFGKKTIRLSNTDFVVDASTSGNVSHFLSRTSDTSRVNLEVRRLRYGQLLLPRLGIYVTKDLTKGMKLRLPEKEKHEEPQPVLVKETQAEPKAEPKIELNPASLVETKAEIKSDVASSPATNTMTNATSFKATEGDAPKAEPRTSDTSNKRPGLDAKSTVGMGVADGLVAEWSAKHGSGIKSAHYPP